MWAKIGFGQFWAKSAQNLFWAGRFKPAQNYGLNHPRPKLANPDSDSSMFSVWSKTIFHCPGSACRLSVTVLPFLAICSSRCI